MRVLLITIFLVVFVGRASAQDFRTRVQDFIGAAEGAVTELDSSYEEIVQLFKEAQNKEGAERRLRELEAKVREASEIYGEKSPLWVQHGSLVQFVEGRRENAVQKFKATGDERWRDQVTVWTEHGRSLQDLRIKVISEADRAAEFAGQFSGEIEIVIDVYLSEGVQAAINELEKVHANLVKLNDSVEGVLESAKRELLPETGN